MHESYSSPQRRTLPLIRWFDSWAGAELEASQPANDRVDWVRCLPLLVMHVGCLGVFWVGWSWIAVLVAGILYGIRMFAITGFYHRYFSHRTFQTSRAAQFLFGVLGNSAVQRGPLWWAAHHRHHHRHSDQPEDVHSPRQHGFWWSHIGWIMTRANFPTDLTVIKDLARFPELRFLDRFDTIVPVLLAASLFGFGTVINWAFPGLGTSGLQMLVWGFFVSSVVLLHGTCTINSLAHVMGRRRYETRDDSKNSLLLALITLGEGWHNNHHHYPAATRQGFYWWEVDITYYTLWILSRLGLIWDLRGVPMKVRQARQL